MASVQINRSTVAGFIPSSLLAGEFFYNEADQILYMGTTDGSIDVVSYNAVDIQQRLAVLESQSTTTVSATEPSAPTDGDFWYNSTNNVLYLYVNGEWQIASTAVGEQAVSGTGSFPVTLDEFYAHIRFTPSAEEELEGVSFIRAATLHAENYTKRFFYNRNFTMYLSEFPKVVQGARNRRLSTAPIRLIGTDVKSITSVNYYDKNGTQQTLDNTNYRLVNKFSTGYLHPSVSSEYWPTDCHDELEDIIEIEYNAGPSVGEVPAPVKSAILLIAASLFENRENDIIGSGLTVNKPIIAAQDLLFPYKVR